MKPRTLASALALAATATVGGPGAPAHAEALRLLGGEFAVSASPHPSQRNVDLDGRRGRGTVVVWTEDDVDGDGAGIRGRRFGVRGQPVGGDFQVNLVTTGRQDVARVAMAADGSFVVVWDDPVSTRARGFAADGSPVGGESVVVLEGELGSLNADTDVTATSSGGFVVVWQQISTDGFTFYETAIRTRALSPDGVAVGATFRVDPGSEYSRREITRIVASPTTHEVLVVWSQVMGNFENVVGRPADLEGAPVAPAFRATEPLFDGRHPAVAVGEDEQVLIAWHANASNGDDADPSTLSARRFEMDGSPLGGQFQVNRATTGSQTDPEVCSVGADGFVVVWTGRDPDWSLRTIGRFVDADGVPRGDDLLMSGWTRKGFPSRCAGPSILATAQPAGIVGQLFRVEIPVFADDFESGDLCAWGGTHGTRDLC